MLSIDQMLVTKKLFRLKMVLGTRNMAMEIRKQLQRILPSMDYGLWSLVYRLWPTLNSPKLFIIRDHETRDLIVGKQSFRLLVAF
jgi:hypothetical protein